MKRSISLFSTYKRAIFFPFFFLFPFQFNEIPTLSTLPSASASAPSSRPRQSRLPGPDRGPGEPLPCLESAPGRGQGLLLRDGAHLERDGRGVAGARPELREHGAAAVPDAASGRVDD